MSSTRNEFIRNLLEYEEEVDELLMCYVANMGESESLHGGSVAGRLSTLPREYELGHERLMADYFHQNAVYPEHIFRRRFRVPKAVFRLISTTISTANSYFVRNRNCAGKLGLSTEQKMTAALRQMAYGCSADLVDEYVRIGESTAVECLEMFCTSVVDCFETQYLRSPNEQDMAKLLHEGQSRGFPGMIGSIDCMHWQWKDCPKGWAGQFQGKEQHPTVILEAVASQSTWIWHSFFGVPGANNDINVLERSPVFTKLLENRMPPVEFQVNGNTYTTPYFLADGIYPKWPTLIQTFTKPQSEKKKHFAAVQESCRKDVERAFGVLQARFAIIKQPARTWKHSIMVKIMKACVIIHNMVVQHNELDMMIEPLLLELPSGIAAEQGDPGRGHEEDFDWDRFVGAYRQMRDQEAYFTLRDDLIDHLWARKGLTL